MKKQTLRRVAAIGMSLWHPTRTSPRLKYYHFHNLDRSDSNVASFAQIFYFVHNNLDESCLKMIKNTAGEIKPSGTGYTGLTLKPSYILLKVLHSVYKMLWYYWENGGVLSQQRWTVNVNICLCFLSTFPQKDSKHFKYISTHETSVNSLTSIQMLFPHFRRGKCR